VVYLGEYRQIIVGKSEKFLKMSEFECVTFTG